MGDRGKDRMVLEIWDKEENGRRIDMGTDRDRGRIIDRGQIEMGDRYRMGDMI